MYRPHDQTQLNGNSDEMVVVNEQPSADMILPSSPPAFVNLNTLSSTDRQRQSIDAATCSQVQDIQQVI